MNIEEKTRAIMAVIKKEAGPPPDALIVIEIVVSDLLSIAESLRSIAQSVEFMTIQRPQA